MSSIVQSAQDAAQAAQAAVDPYIPQAAKDAAGFAYDSLQIAVQGATTTITAITPTPVVEFVSSTAESARAAVADPVGTVKPYVPTYIIEAGEKTYEVVHPTLDSAYAGATEAAGFIVTKVNGTVEYISHLPEIQSVLAQIQGFLGGKAATAAEPAAKEQ